MINKTKQKYVDLMIKYVKQFPDKFNKLIVYGESTDPSIVNPSSLDFAVGLVNPTDEMNYDLLGNALDYLGEILAEGDGSFLPIGHNTYKPSYLELIKTGEVVYEI